MKKSLSKSYLDVIRERKKTSRVYVLHQATGLALAEILEDNKHKSLYIKLAKEGNSQMLIELAKDVASRRGVKNKGAYFMKLLKNKK